MSTWQVPVHPGTGTGTGDRSIECLFHVDTIGTHTAARQHQLRPESCGPELQAGTLKRNERLPSLRDLARQRSVSLATVTLAYRVLEDSRLIEARPRSGYYVASRAPSLPEPPEPPESRPPPESRLVDRSALAARVMALADSPDHVSFGAACPGAEMFDQSRIRKALTRAALRHRDKLTKYAIGGGHPDLRRAVARHALRLGCELDPARIIVTNGCVESVSLSLRAVTRPGDIVAIESPTHFGLLEILEQFGLRALEIPTHPRSGLSIDALQFAIETQAVRAVLSVPTLHNPVGPECRLPRVANWREWRRSTTLP